MKPPPWLRSLIAALALSALAITLPLNSHWRSLEYWVFDLWTQVAPHPVQTLPITLVTIDDLSLQQLRMRWPWSRRVHAHIIERLKALGAHLIVFDVLFSQATKSDEDQALAEAIRQAGNVILVAARRNQDTSYGTLTTRQEPLPLFQEAGAQIGLANLGFDTDLVVREVPEGREILWRQILNRLAQLVPDIDPEVPRREGAMIRFFGPARNFPEVPIFKVLDDPPSLSPDAFDGQVVLIGRVSRATVDLGSDADLFATPFTAHSGIMIPGVEIHATLLENGVRRLAITPFEPLSLWLLTILVGLAVSFVLPHLGIITGGLYAASLLAALWGASYGLFVTQARWLPVLALSTPPLLAFFGKFLFFVIQERRQKNAIRQMFALYVPPDVVQSLTAHPERLSLGGESRELSVLFTDLEGFTSHSETLGPRRIARLINLYLDAMTQVIFDHGGTVDKYIGDAIMAFWNAPLEIPNHPRQALAAALAMQQALPALNTRLQAEGLPAIAMRIGLHSGEAIVGNLGSTRRFSYTAVGDTVNLAARLEPLNKHFGTAVLVSEDTARCAGELIPLRILDRVRVRGRNRPLSVYTIAPDAAFAQRAGQAFAAYRERRWDEAQALLTEQLSDCPKDPASLALIARIESFRVTPPPEEWDGTGA